MLVFFNANKVRNLDIAKKSKESGRIYKYNYQLLTQIGFGK